MNSFKCKMCGGTIEYNPGDTVGVCDSCGSKQTLPKATDDAISNLFIRANNLRLKCEFDKAQQTYEKIVELDDSEAEAHWGIVLCKYGIEYIEDPSTSKRIPTCHRTMFESVVSDTDYQAAIDYSDSSQQAIYEDEARTIDRLQRDILAVVKDEKPFDVFLCYKETDASGNRTIDSAIANDIYYELTNVGYNVFYAPITLESKLGRSYEPYIFAAINSAKVMLVIGTKPEYFNAVWVKNEWSRFLKLTKTNRNKILIPCYRDMDAYDLPQEFSYLQAQDMSKIGFINDIVRGIQKVSSPAPAAQTVLTAQPDQIVPPIQTINRQPVAAAPLNTANLLKRAKIFLESGDFTQATEYAEKVLDIDAENGEAYLVELMAKLRIKTEEEFKTLKVDFTSFTAYKNIISFGSQELIDRLNGYLQIILNRLNEERIIAEKQKKVNELISEKRKCEKNIISFSSLLRTLENQEKEIIVRKDVDYASGRRHLKCAVASLILAISAVIIYLIGTSEYVNFLKWLGGACALSSEILLIIFEKSEGKLKTFGSVVGFVLAGICTLGIFHLVRICLGIKRNYRFRNSYDVVNAEFDAQLRTIYQQKLEYIKRIEEFRNNLNNINQTLENVNK